MGGPSKDMTTGFFNFTLGRKKALSLVAALIALLMVLSPELKGPAYASGSGQITVNVSSGPANSSIEISIGSSTQTVSSDNNGFASAVFSGLSDGSYFPSAYVNSQGFHTYAPTSNPSYITIDSNNPTDSRSIVLRPVFTVVANVSGIPQGVQNLQTQVTAVGMGFYNSSVMPVSLPATTETVNIQDLPTGTWNLVFSADGLASATVQVVVGSSQITNVNAVLTPTNSITGVISDAGGNPLSGVDISVNSGCSGNACSDTTNAQGQYALSGLTSNTFQINLEKQVGTTAITSYRNVTVSGGTLNLTMAIGSASVSGFIRSEEQNFPAIANARISGSQTVMDGLSYTTNSANDGSYTVSGLVAGSINVSVSKVDSQTYQNLFVNSNSNVIIQNGQSRSKDFYLTPVPTGSNSLSGRVSIQGSNNAVSGAWINISNYASGLYRSTTSNGSGDYTVSNLPNGTYWVNVSSADFQYQSRKVVISGNKIENFSLSQLATGNLTVSGSIVDTRTNLPVQGAQIYLWGTGRSYSATSAANGSWSISGVANGKYITNVNPPQNQQNVYEWPNVPDIVVQGSNVSTNISLRSVVAGTGRIYGVLKNNINHLPIAGATVTTGLQWAGNYTIDPVVTNARGEFSFDYLPAGTYSVWAEKDGFVEIKLSNPEEDAEMGFGSGGPLVGEIDLLEGEQAYLAAKLTPVISGSGAISGTLMTASGRVLSDQWIWLEDSRGQWSGSVVTDENGEFVFSNLASGTFYINSSVQGLGSTQQKTVVSGTTTIQDLVIRPLGFIAGKVLDQSGNSVPCALVTAYRKNSDGTRGPIVSADQAEYTTANGVGSGTYSLSVPDGTYFLRVSQNCWNNDEKIIVDFASAFWNQSSLSGTELPVSEIVVQGGQTVDEKNFAVSANGGQITGTVVAKTSSGVAPLAQGKFVTITVYKNISGTFEPQGYLSKWTSGRQGGDFSINGLPAGTYKLKISDPSNSTRGYETQYVGGSSLSNAEVFTITAGRRIHIGQNELVNKVPQGDPNSVDSSQLTASTENMIDAPEVVEANQTISVEVGKDMAGEWVSVWAHSTPTALGDWVQVNADGTVTATVSESLPAGQHRIVVQDVDNQVVGWSATTVAASVQGSSSTGGQARKVVSSLTNIGASSPSLESPVTVSPKKSSGESNSTNSAAETAPTTKQQDPNMWIFGGLLALLAAGIAGGIWLIRTRKS